MNDVIAQLGQAAGREKAASVALVRRMQQGLLKPQTVQRAAAAMPPGKFRTVGNLGQGQFNVADHVVGNIGGQAGSMVRKLPTHAYPEGLQQAYEPVVQTTSRLNQHFPAPHGSAPYFTPYNAATPQGAFQQFATGQTPMRPGYRANNAAYPIAVPKPGASQAVTDQINQISNSVSDLHRGNMGPGGQIMDYIAGPGWTPNQKTVGTVNQSMARIDPNVVLPERRGLPPAFERYSQPMLHDYESTRYKMPDGTIGYRKLPPQASQQNAVRRFWHSPQEQQTGQTEQMFQQQYSARMRPDAPGGDAITADAPASLPGTAPWTETGNGARNVPWAHLARFGLPTMGGLGYGAYRMYNRQSQPQQPQMAGGRTP